MKTVSRTLQLFIGVLVIVIGLSAASVRVLFPNADRYRDDLETWLADIVGQPVDIGSLQAQWRGWRPEFRINELRLRNPTQRGKDGGVNARFESATVSIDVLASLLSGELRPVRIHMGDISLRVQAAAGTVGPDAAIHQHALALLSWLKSQQSLKLDATRVELSDLRVANAPVTFTNLHLVVSNKGTAHALEVAVDLPGDRNGAIRANAAIIGDPTSAYWSGNIALNVEELNLATVQAWRQHLGGVDVSGRASLTLESRWKAGGLIEADGDLALRELRAASDAGAVGPLNTKARIDVAGGDGDWRLQLTRADGGLLSFHEAAPLATLRYTGEPTDAVARVSASIATLEIADLVPLLPLAVPATHDLWQQVADAAPGGQLRDLAMTITRDADGIRDVNVAGAFRDFGMRSSGGWPSLSAVSGDFEHGAGATRVRLSDGSLQASIPEWFPEPLAGKQLHGLLSWTEHGDERRLTLSDVGLVTPDVTARATGELVWNDDDAVPFLDLSLGFRDADLARLEYYIPTGIFGPKTGAWLNQAFLAGRVSAGSVEVRGRPPQELEGDTDFDVTVHAAVEDATVHYLDGWPSTERVTGTLHIADRKLVAKVSEAYFYAARVRPGRLVVADILADDPIFEWRPRIDGRTEDAIRFLRESPLRQGFRSLLDNVKAAGSASLALDLRLALASGVPQLTGALDVAANTIDVPSLHKGFKDVSGRVRFDQDGMSGDGVTGEYLGRTVVAGIESVAERSGHTRVRISGQADAAYIARHLHNAGLLPSPEISAMPVLTRLDGQAAWQAGIDVIEHTAPGESPVVLRVESDLLGAALALPAPFGKPAGTPLPLAVEARFADAGHREMHLDLASLASGVFELQADADGYRLRRAAVRLGGEPASLPDEAAIEVSGHLQQVALSDWSALMLNPDDRSDADGALPARVDLRLDRLDMLGARFADVYVQANTDAGGRWRASISGPDVDGTISIPASQSAYPIVAEFDRLVVTPMDSGESDTIDPRDVPPLRFTCGQCSFGEMLLRDVQVVTSRRDDGISIDSLRVRNDGFLANADGAWTIDAEGAQRTRLDVRLNSDDLGKFLASLGHKGGATRGGVTDITLAASWDGPPSDFDLQAVEGVLHFRAGEGTLTEVRRGTTGRLFSLLVVPDLPRRLKGDFRDLFEDGFVYKQIEGTFNIARGNAYTNDLTLEGSLARIDIAGRTGLTDEDYDQLMTVTPKLSDSLPLMPIWLVEKAIQRELINKLFAYQYSITGSWEDPDVTPIVVEHQFPSDRS